ncbi:MAG: hypothetical protein K9N49_01090 [Candidatus Marinimicrobia bacterium]|nr:hypothetical protein [Candidatus Neomarinimicrobiota bacterium]
MMKRTTDGRGWTRMGLGKQDNRPCPSSSSAIVEYEGRGRRRGGVLSALVVLGCLLFQSAAMAADGSIRALSDDFSNGNIHTDPAWVGGDLNWNNTFFAEKLEGKWYATTRQYGSMGTWFTLPPERVWPVALDPALGPMRLSLTVRFRPDTRRNFVNFSVLGPQSDGRWGAKFGPDGDIWVRVVPTMTDRGGASVHVPTPQMRDGKPVRFAFVLGGHNAFELWRDGEQFFVLAEDEREAFRDAMRRYERLAFLGSTAVADENPYYMSPTFQDTHGDFWITDIEVRGVPERIEPSAGLTLDAAPKTMLALRGVGGLDTTLFSDLAEAGWNLTTVFDQTENPAQNPLQQHLSLENLCRFQSVTLLDIPATRLGRHGCAALREYVRAGGQLFILGGVTTLNRGRYFSSPLAECLPVTGEEGWDTLDRTTDSAAYEYAYRVQVNPGAETASESPRLVVSAFGKGRVLVCPWTTLGAPHEPFWTSPALARSIAEALQGLTKDKP